MSKIRTDNVRSTNFKVTKKGTETSTTLKSKLTPEKSTRIEKYQEKETRIDGSVSNLGKCSFQRPSAPSGSPSNAIDFSSSDSPDAILQYERAEIEATNKYEIDAEDAWYLKKNEKERYLRTIAMEFLSALWYNTLVGIGFRVLGNSWSFGLLQGFTFYSMLAMFWYDDFGFSNIFLTIALCFLRLLRSKEYWIFFLHLAGQLSGTLLAMAGIMLTTNDLPGIQTFGTPTKSVIISETSAGFSEFVASFLIAFSVLWSVFVWTERVKPRFKSETEKKEKIRKKRYDTKVPYFSVSLGLLYTAASICFYDLTGSSFNFLRWAIPRLCMGHYDLNPHDALYYMVANFVAVFSAAVLVFVLMTVKKRLGLVFIKRSAESDLTYVV